jgi:hypothetical protein
VATNGFKGRGLSFATGDYAWERGLIAESNVPLEEAVLVVPRRVAITDDPTLLEPSPTATLNWGVRPTPSSLDVWGFSRVQKGVNRKVVSRPRILACDRTKRW